MSIENKSLRIQQLYQELENEILKTIADFIKSGQPITDETNITYWKLEKLRLLGELNNRHKLILSEYAEKSFKEITEFIDEVGYKQAETTQTRIDPYIQMGALDYIPSENVISEMLNSLYVLNQSKVNLIHANVLHATGQTYVEMLEKASMDALSGNKTLYQSVKDATLNMANKGIPALIAIDGRKLSLDGYIPMVIRTTQKQVGAQIESGLMDAYEIDLVEISSHMGSRPSHAPFQGRIFSRSGTSDKYPPLSSTGYGQIDGLITGINCRHLMYPYIEGVNKPSYKPVDTKKNEESYKLSQQQRKLERDIRAAKREKLMAESLEDKEAQEVARQKILKNQAKLREFIKQADLPRKRQREQVKGISR